MRQLVQNLRSGKTELVESPAPQVRPGHILIKTAFSLVSLGTERMVVNSTRGGIIGKAFRNPDKVKQVIDKMRTAGAKAAINAVQSRLDEPVRLGYCNAGTVLAVGDGVTDINVGDRVASNGGHAELVVVPRNLCARIPDGVPLDKAAFTVLGSITLQGIRLVKPELGETVAVIGLGLIGELSIQMLKACGCRVIGFDIDPAKVDIARKIGATAYAVGESCDPEKAALDLTDGVGVDAVIITAAAKTNDIIAQAAHMCRKRGRIVLVGVVGLELNRSDWYEKELTFQVSCSYGPGRYDPEYEEKGRDYPLPFVRWTEQRNMGAVLDMLASGALDVGPLITHRIAFEKAAEIYAGLSDAGAMGIILEYPDTVDMASRIQVVPPRSYNPVKGVVGIIGAGNFAKGTIIPALKKAGADIRYIASRTGVSAAGVAKRHGIATATSRCEDILQDDTVDAVIIATRHDLHGRLVLQSMRAEKHVFVEKPLCLTRQELDEIIEAYNSQNRLLTDSPKTDLLAANPQIHAPSLMVGFNRRFSPLSQKIRELVSDGGPLNMVLTMNAGFIPQSHWTQDLEVGGGRIIGEACHLVDLAVYLSGSTVTSVAASGLGTNTDAACDNVIITMRMANGTHAVVNYFANGHRSYPKERLEVYGQGRVLVMDDFRTLTGYGFKGFKRLKLSTQDKGHNHLFAAFVNFLKNGGMPPIPFDQIINVTKATFAAVEAMRTKTWVTF